MAWVGLRSSSWLVKTIWQTAPIGSNRAKKTSTVLAAVSSPRGVRGTDATIESAPAPGRAGTVGALTRQYSHGYHRLPSRHTGCDHFVTRR